MTSKHSALFGGISLAAILLAYTALASPHHPVRASASVWLSPVALTAVRSSHDNTPLAALANVEMQDWDSDPNHAYKQFFVDDSGYEGIFTYTLPAGLLPSSVLQVRLHTNQRGPTRDTQRWWWEIRNFQNNSWVELGDNTNAENWRWAYRVFTVSLPAGQVINAGGALQVRYQTDANMDMSAIDYMVIELVTTSASGHFAFVPVVHREPSSAHTPTASPSPTAPSATPTVMQGA